MLLSSHLKELVFLFVLLSQPHHSDHETHVHEMRQGHESLYMLTTADSRGDHRPSHITSQSLPPESGETNNKDAHTSMSLSIFMFV